MEETYPPLILYICNRNNHNGDGHTLAVTCAAWIRDDAALTVACATRAAENEHALRAHKEKNDN